MFVLITTFRKGNLHNYIPCPALFQITKLLTSVPVFSYLLGTVSHIIRGSTSPPKQHKIPSSNLVCLSHCAWDQKEENIIMKAPQHKMNQR